MADVVALIGARAGSKGVPGKNILPLGGHSLLAWSVAACQRSFEIGRIIVSTDSAEYAAVAQELGAEAPFLRPAEISGDDAPDSDFILHALDWLTAQGDPPSYIVHIRTTTPFRDPALIDEAVHVFREATDVTALRSVHEMSESAYKSFEIVQGRLLKQVGAHSLALDTANNARQQFPPTYSANGYVDVLSTEFIRRTHLIHGDRVIAFVTPPVVEVDTAEDVAQLQYQLDVNPGIARKVF